MITYPVVQHESISRVPSHQMKVSPPQWPPQDENSRTATAWTFCIIFRWKWSKDSWPTKAATVVPPELRNDQLMLRSAIKGSNSIEMFHGTR